MSIASRIQEIETHLENDWTNIEALGGSAEDRNIKNIAGALDDVWEALPHVTDTGTDLSLNTKQGRTKTILKGNTSQIQYSGIQLIPKATKMSGSTTNPQTYNGITFTNIGSGHFYLKGTATAQADILIFRQSNEGESITVPVGTYTFSSPSLPSGVKVITSGGGGNGFVYTELTSSNLKATSNVTDGTVPFNYIDIRVANGTNLSNGIDIYFMLESGSEKHDWQPYVGGTPSPNPSYPKPINVVSGDNEVVVCGINIWDEQWELGTFNTTTGDNNSSTTQIRSKNLIDIFSNTLYYFNNPTSSNIGYWMMFYDKEGNIITGYTPSTNNSKSGNSFKCDTNKPTIVTPPNAKKMKFYLTVDYGATYNNDICINISNASINGNYYPYTGSSYPINLPVENLFENILTSQTINDVVFTVNEDKSIYVKGTASARTEPNIWTNDNGRSLTLKAGITYYNNTNATLYFYANGYYSINSYSSYTPASDLVVSRIYIRIENGDVVDTTIYPMLSLQNVKSYTPYGTTPIELNKIDTYKDEFIRTSGKDLFDKNERTNQRYVSKDTGELVEYSSSFATDYIEIKPNTNYYWNDAGRTNQGAFYDSSKTYISGITTKGFTTPSNAKYVRLTGENTLLNQLQLEENTQATPYEPYGTDEWWLKKAIGKVVYTGAESENWVRTKANRFNILSSIQYPLNIGKYYLSNLYTAYNPTINDGGFDTLVANVDYGFNLSSNNPNVRIKDTRVDTISDFKTALNTKNLIVNIPEATPTYTKLNETYPTLTSQLEAAWRAKTFNTQTNISQINNDLPFELFVTALESDE